MSHVHVALLRGINVGTAKRVAMADLKAVMESLGYGEVRTLLNSGNVVFTSRRPAVANDAARIEKALAARVGVASRVVVLTGAELEKLVAKNPLQAVATNPSRLLVTVLYDPGDRKKLEPLLKQDWGKERLALGERAAYVWCPEGLVASPLSQTIGRALGDAITTRNWATMTRLHAIAQSLNPAMVRRSGR